MKARALESCLWEVETLVASDIDEKVRTFAKIFKGDLTRKTEYIRIEEYLEEPKMSLEGICDDLLAELESIDVRKEAMAVNRRLLFVNGQLKYDEK